MTATGADTTRLTWAAQERAHLAQVADDHLGSVLAAMAGADARAHPDQARAVEALVADQARVLVVQATGWGKSAVYWAATSAIRALGGGPIDALLVASTGQVTHAQLRIRKLADAQLFGIRLPTRSGVVPIHA
jgi:hypothetical protein